MSEVCISCACASVPARVCMPPSVPKTFLCVAQICAFCAFLCVCCVQSLCCKVLCVLCLRRFCALQKSVCVACQCVQSSCCKVPCVLCCVPVRAKFVLQSCVVCVLALYLDFVKCVAYLWQAKGELFEWQMFCHTAVLGPRP